MESAETSTREYGEDAIRLQVESVIDNILVSNRQGRNLEGYDEVYSDPDVRNALQRGNDTIARTYIREKLCSLGLMNVSSLRRHMRARAEKKVSRQL